MRLCSPGDFMNSFLESLKLEPGAVVRDATGTVWLKVMFLWQRTGSAGFYDGNAIVYPVEVLIPRDNDG